MRAPTSDDVKGCSLRRQARRWLLGAAIVGMCIPFAVVAGVGVAFVVLDLRTEQTGAAFAALLALRADELWTVFQLGVLSALPFGLYGYLARWPLSRDRDGHGRTRQVLLAGLVAMTIWSTFLWAATASDVYRILGGVAGNGTEWPLSSLWRTFVLNAVIGYGAAGISMAIAWLLGRAIGGTARPRA